MSESEDVKAEGVGQEDQSEEPTSEEPSSQGDAQPAEIASQLMKNPQVLAALQNRLGDIVGSSSGYIQSLPKPVKRRIKALKKIQFDATKIEAEFYREVHKLECKYADRYAPLYEKRLAVVSGDHEPNDEEADWPSDDEKDEELSDTEKDSEEKKEEVKKASIDEKEKTDEEEKEKDVKGVPGFWLTIFKNVDMLSEMIQPQDEAILNLLREVKVEFVDVNDVKEEKDPMGFKLLFHFDSNEYFENKVLTKEYVMRSVPDETDPFSFEGPEIVKCQGCTIDWKKGKNVTVKTVKKKQKHKASGTTRTISKTVQSDSFFNFFNPPTPPDDEEMDEDTEALLAADFEIGHFIRERIVPRAVLYFTGEALENDDDYEDGEEEEGEGDDYDEDADGDYNPEDGKFLTASFQAECAKLALAQVSKPSSAPNDTRLVFRPNSASNPRPLSVSGTKPDNVPSTANDTKARPVTAPYSRPSTQHDKSKNSAEQNDEPKEVSKPAVVKEAFIEQTKEESDDTNITIVKQAESPSSRESKGSKSSIKSAVKEEPAESKTEGARPKSVSFKTTKSVGIEDQGEAPKLERERTHVLSSVIEPEITLAREQTFFDQLPTRENKSKETKTDSKEVPTTSNQPNKKEANVVGKNVPEAGHILKDQSKKTPMSRSGKQNPRPVEDKPSVVIIREVEEKVDIKNVPAKTDTGLSKIRKGKSDVKGQVTAHTGNLSESRSKGQDGEGEDSNSKAMHEGTRSSKAGQRSGIVDIKNIYSSKGKTNPPSGGTSQSKKQANSKDAAFTILKHLTGKRGPGTHKPGQVPKVQRTVRRYTFEKPVGPPASKIIQSIIDGTDKPKEADKPSPIKVQTKTAMSAPSSSTKPRQPGQNRRSTSGMLRPQKKETSTNPQSAPPHKVRMLPKGAHEDSIPDQGGSGSLQGLNTINKKGQMLDATQAQSAGIVSASGAFQKGVRLQNGMIATETDKSETFCLEDNSDYTGVPNLHPKYKESPYLKGNPLLQSGKPRLSSSASSAGRDKDGNH